MLAMDGASTSLGTAVHKEIEYEQGTAADGENSESRGAPPTIDAGYARHEYHLVVQYGAWARRPGPEVNRRSGSGRASRPFTQRAGYVPCTSRRAVLAQKQKAGEPGPGQSLTDR